MIELDELHSIKRSLESQIDNFFCGDKNPHHGDRGYQDLLERLDEVEERIKEVQNEKSE